MLAVTTPDATVVDQPPKSEVPPSSVQLPHNDGQVATSDLWRIVWHRRLWIFSFTAVLVLAAIAYSILTPWLYTANAQLLIDPRDKVVVTNDVNPSAMAPDGGVTQVESQVRVIESSNVLLRAIKAAGLANDPDFSGPPGALARLANKIDALLGRSRADEADDGMQKALTSLRKRLAIKRADKVFVVDVIFTARSPEKAARVANAIAQAYLDEQAAARSGAARDASQALMGRLEEQKRKVTDAENAVESYKKQHAIVAAANGILVGDQQLTDVNAQLSAARQKTAELRARVGQIDAARRAGISSDATDEALGSAVITQLRSRAAALGQQSADLNAQYGRRHPAIASIEAQLSDVRRRIAIELNRIVGSATADYQRATANEAALARTLARVTNETLATKQASVRLRELERDLEASRTVYASFLLRAQETREQSTIDSSNARIITTALPPLERSWPLVGFLVLGALGAGLGLGLAAAFASEYVSPIVHSADQLQRVMGLPVIPVSIPIRRARRRRFWSRRASVRFGAPPPAINDIAFDLVLRRVFEAGPSARKPQRLFSVLLTSGPRNGARTAELARYLASAAEGIGERVLLIDAAVSSDEGPNAPGFLDVLRGDTSLDSAVKRYPDSKVVVLCQGNPRPGHLDWRRAHNANRLFAQAGRHYDIMIVNGGVAVENPRLAAILGEVDDLFLVAEREQTPQRDLLEAAEAVTSMGGSPSASMLVEVKGRG